MDALSIATLAAAVGCGLIAGVFYAFSTFVMRALGRVPEAEGARAMQAINETVLTPWFLVPFVGLAPLCIGLGVVAVRGATATPSVLLLVGSVLYVAGTFAQTRLAHIPLNDALAEVDADSPEGAALWVRYLARWTRWNHVRTAASLLAAAAFTAALAL